MKTPPPSRRRSLPATSRRAFTLVEAMVVLTILGVLIAMTVPHYERAIEQSRADIAAANLRAVWAAQRLYWLEHRTFASSLTDLQAARLLDPAVVLASTGYVYSVVSAGTAAFCAAAVRSGSPRWSGEFSVDETGVVSGVVVASGEPSISPGFQ